MAGGTLEKLRLIVNFPYTLRRYFFTFNQDSIKIKNLVQIKNLVLKILNPLLSIY